MLSCSSKINNILAYANELAAVILQYLQGSRLAVLKFFQNFINQFVVYLGHAELYHAIIDENDRTFRCSRGATGGEAFVAAPFRRPDSCRRC
jgi:hypothetical protein